MFAPLLLHVSEQILRTCILFSPLEGPSVDGRNPANQVRLQLLPQFSRSISPNCICSNQPKQTCKHVLIPIYRGAAPLPLCLFVPELTTRFQGVTLNHPVTPWKRRRHRHQSLEVATLLHLRAASLAGG